MGTWQGGREKAPAAFCRKALTSEKEFEMWGDGLQTRSFTFIDDCVEGVLRLTFSDCDVPINLIQHAIVAVVVVALCQYALHAVLVLVRANHAMHDGDVAPIDVEDQHFARCKG